MDRRNLLRKLLLLPLLLIGARLWPQTVLKGPYPNYETTQRLLKKAMDTLDSDPAFQARLHESVLKAVADALGPKLEPREAIEGLGPHLLLLDSRQKVAARSIKINFSDWT